MKVILSVLIAGSLPVVRATFSIAKCCTLAVRQDFHAYIADFYPWEVCSFNTEIDYGNNQTLPSIVRSMAWAKEYCRGAEYSSLKQWLLPLSTYISPYIGVLLICPVGDVAVHVLEGRVWKPLNSVFNGLAKYIQEYVSILGDPGSAMFGALNEIWSDAWALSNLKLDKVTKTLGIPSEEPTEALLSDTSAMWIAVLAGDIEFTRKTRWYGRGGSQSTDVLGYKNIAKSEAQLGGETSLLNISPGEKDQQASASENPLKDASQDEDKINKAIEMVIIARKGFVSGILIPVLLLLAVTAATFYDAYSKMGDKDTGLALAYCVWFSWVLVLGVAGNCYASAINPGLAERAFSTVLNFGGAPFATSLRHRYVNNHYWEEWANSKHPDAGEFASAARELLSKWTFWLRFCAGQLLGFCVVAFSSACAVAIAWTTPTVGLGCRSFNFILYVVFAFVNAYLHVLCSWLTVREDGKESKSIREGQASSAISFSQKLSALVVVRGIYWFFVFVNSLVMVLGTIFHLVGVFRTCWCERLTWVDSTLIELNSKTPQAVDNARRYWLSTAYVAFGIVWLMCLTAIAFRRYIVQKMEDWLEAREAEGVPTEDPRLD
ncbi:hypothetical protein UCRPA7_3829 [Phaeoacremonium minimum UCRPA7]|uniref:Uncharacterized protein n=1 Tax=Phaeoacremonium minimum (strain UCR-PA7) TaxID=1286976 RepID=R8BN19_PHAM7|nr:hypothetical protein UCRPA7_3829 [Phaeoacremonium minimum UCRPA7]EOO00739.1 hypothetical protein UCRPA7_3829 [Phaeoacremonium minimum UCRPA7]